MDENAELIQLKTDYRLLYEEYNRLGIHSAVMEQRLKNVEEDIERMVLHAEARYVSLSRYLPVERAVYGVIGLICITFIGGLLSLVVRQ